MGKGLLHAFLALAMVLSGSFLGIASVQAEDVSVQQIQFSPEFKNRPLQLQEGGSAVMLSYYFVPENPTNKRVTWSSSNPTVAEVYNGMVTPKSPGRTTIIVVSEDGGKMDTCEVIVNAKAVPVTGVELNKSSLALTVGSTQKLYATITPSNATDKKLNWRSTNTDVVKVDSDGNISAVGVGRATIVVTTQDGGKVDSCEITVTGVEISSVSLNKTSLTLYTNGSSERLEATVKPTSASNKTVIWSSSDTSVATVNSSGTVTPISAGTAVITARTINGDKTATCKVTVIKGSGKVKDFEIEKLSKSSVKFTWSGTNGKTLVEIKKSNSSRVVDSKETSLKSVTFTGLSSDTKYEVYVNEDYMESFTLTDNKVKNLKTTKVSSSSVEISWSGTKGTVEVELRKEKNNTRVDKKNSSSGKVKFTSLSSDTEYKVYIDDEYMDTFILEDVRNFKVENKTTDSVEISWSGTSGSVKVLLKKHDNDKQVDDTKTDRKKAKFTGLDDDTEYDVYINNMLVGSFKTESASKLKNVKVVKNSRLQSIEVTWEGTKGSIEVSLKKNGAAYTSRQSSAGVVRFEGIPANQEFAVYVDKKYIQTVTLTFKDVENHWAQAPIERMAQHNVISGFADGTFRPEQTVTREEFVKLLVQAKRYTLVRGASSFKDVNQSRWSEPYISTAIRNGIIDPASFGQFFAPEQAIPREEMAVYIARALKLPADAKALTFTDNYLIQAKNKGLVGAVVKARIINGYPDNTFKPKGSLTRAAAAQVINQIFMP